MKSKWLLPLVVIVLALAGCGNAAEPDKKENAGSKLQIYTTVYPLQYFAERIGGTNVNVESIYPPGTDEHTFEPSQKDMMKLADADLFFYIGLGLEGFAEKAQSTLKNEGVQMIATGEHLDLPAHTGEHEDNDEDHEEDGHHHGDTDPHVWLDPIYAEGLAAQIRDELIKAKPEHQKDFEENFTSLKAELNSLDENFKEAVAQAKRHEIIVSHAAYGYWEKRYGIEQIALSGVSSTAEPSQRKLQEITDLVKAENVHYILSEQNVNQKLIGIIQKETGTEVLMLHNLGVLLQKDIDADEDYFTLMNRNIEVIKTALSE